MLENRKQIILIFFFAIGILYLSRLFYLQLLDEKYQSIEATNAIKRQIEIPLRGQIYDRNQKLIVANEEVYDMYVTPAKVKNLDTLRFCKVFGITKTYFDSTMAIAVEYSKNRASPFIRQLTKTDYARVADAMINFSGFNFELSFFRTYPGHTMANALGYIGEIPRSLYEKQAEPYYRKGDYIGLAGLEKEYENELRGNRGVRFTLMDVKGQDKGVYAEGKYDTTAVIGQNLYSSIDLQLQQLADSLFQNKVGAIVAIEPKTGEILTMGSYPTYDPALLSGKEFSKNYGLLSIDPDKPFLNRATSSFYRPGSTFKLVQAVVGQQQGVITPTTSFIGKSAPVACHGHGANHLANLNHAVQYSCNPYFFHVFKRIIENNEHTNPFVGARDGLLRWHNMVEKFGFGIKLGIDLPGEKAGLLPNITYYDKIYGENRWKFSNIYSLSIGEGELGVNVLKLANMAATFANRGYWITPHLVKGVGANKANMRKELLTVHQTGVEPRHFEAIMDGMEDVARAGTARRAYIEGIPILGKTGTSQNRKGKDHAVFIAFAPRYNPKIAIAVVVENAGFGGSAAAPIASLIIEQFIKGKIDRQALKTQTMNASFATVAARNSN